MKLLFFCVSALALCACDSRLRVDATITIPADLQQSLVTFPQEVVVDFGLGFGPERVYIICDEAAQDLVIEREAAEFGCAEDMAKTTIRVWVAAFTPEPYEESLCGATFYSNAENMEPLLSDPFSLAQIFQEVPEKSLLGCTSASESVELMVAF